MTSIYGHDTISNMMPTNENEFPTIQTERLLINALMLDDIKTFYTYRTHLDIVRYQGLFPANKEQVQQLITQQTNVDFGKLGQWFQFAVRLLPEQTIIGDIGLNFNSPFIPQVEIAYSISPAYQRKGYARESVQALLEYCISGLQMEVIAATIDVRNIASQQLLKKLGFQRMAFRPHACYLRGEWCDEEDFALFANKWYNLQT